MAKHVSDDDLKRVSGGSGFHVSPEPDPGTTPRVPPSIGPGTGAPGGPGPGPEAEGDSSGNQKLAK
jgi:hypothetical protein